MDKQGMEMWMIVLLILSLILLLAVIIWYSGLGKQIGELLKGFGGVLYG